MEALIIHCHTIFDEQNNMTSHASSPPLPPAPLGETVPPAAYGSTHTKFSEYDSQQQFNAPLPQAPTPRTTGDDFTPQLPSRPPASIHPSSRGNTGSSNGLSNPSTALTEAEAHITSPPSSVPSLPLPLRPGRRGALTPIQGLRGTRGLDFSQQETSGEDWAGLTPASPLSSDPPSPPPSTFKPPQVLPPPPPSALAYQQQQPVLTQTTTQERPQPKAQPPPPSETVERTTVGDIGLVATSFKAPSTGDDRLSTDHASPITSDPPTGPAPQPVAPQPSIQEEPQAPLQVNETQKQSQPSLIYYLGQPEEVPQGGHESRDEAPPSES